jgi:hypothetical protein
MEVQIGTPPTLPNNVNARQNKAFSVSIVPITRPRMHHLPVHAW